MGKTRQSTIETSPDAYNNQPSCQYMCMVMVANEIDEAVDVRPGELKKELNNYYHSFVAVSAGVPPTHRVTDVEMQRLYIQHNQRERRNE